MHRRRGMYASNDFPVLHTVSVVLLACIDPLRVVLGAPIFSCSLQ